MVNGSEMPSAGHALSASESSDWLLRLASILSGNYFYGPDRAGVNGDISGQGCHGLINFAAFHDSSTRCIGSSHSNAEYFARVFEVINSANRVTSSTRRA